MSFNDDDIDLRELQNTPINEILDEQKETDSVFPYEITKEDQLELERDFAIVSARLLDHELTQEEATKKAICSMREYYTDDENGCKDKEIDAWLKHQENEHNIGSCYFDDEPYGDENDQQYDDDCGSCYDDNDYRDEGYDIPELWCRAGISDEEVYKEIGFEVGPDLEIHDEQYFKEKNK